MPFKEGQEKTGGRKKGSPNKATKQRRELISDLLDDEWPDVVDTLNRLKLKDPKSYLAFIKDIMEFDTAKLQRTEIIGDPDAPVVVQTYTLPGGKKIEFKQ